MPFSAAQYGLSAASTEDLDEEAAAALLEAYEADKRWSAQGPASVTRPPPLRAGRIVCELYDSKVVSLSLVWMHLILWDLGKCFCKSTFVKAIYDSSPESCYIAEREHWVNNGQIIMSTMFQ